MEGEAQIAEGLCDVAEEVLRRKFLQPAHAESDVTTPPNGGRMDGFNDNDATAAAGTPPTVNINVKAGSASENDVRELVSGVTEKVGEAVHTWEDRLKQREEAARIAAVNPPPL